jgi:hypothetical protein
MACHATAEWMVAHEYKMSMIAIHSSLRRFFLGAIPIQRMAVLEHRLSQSSTFDSHTVPMKNINRQVYSPLCAD